MIRLRRVFERGRAHPILGPIVLVVLVLLLAMVFLHITLEGMEAAAEVGAMCVAISTALGLLLPNRLRSCLPETVIPEPGDRGPPRSLTTYLRKPAMVAALPSSIPLRR